MAARLVFSEKAHFTW